MRIVRRFLKVIGIILVLIVVLAMIKVFVLSPSSRPAPSMTARNTPEAVARGEYLAKNVMGCIYCHSQGDPNAPGAPITDPTPFAGRDWTDKDGPGVLVAPNLTFDGATGLGNWTDGEVVRAIREGVSRDGHALFMMMPYPVYAQTMSDEDALAIVSYLRSLTPVSRSLPRTKLKFPISALVRLMPEPLETPASVPTEGTEQYDAWLLRAALCSSCHDTIDERHQTIPGKELAGGQLIDEQRLIYAPNITPDLTTGIGGFSDEDILNTLDGKARNGRPLELMPASVYRGLTDGDKKAIVRALRRMPPVVNAVGASK